MTHIFKQFHITDATFIDILHQELSGITSVEIFNNGNDLHLAVGTSPDLNDDEDTAVNPLILDGNVIGEYIANVWSNSS